MEELAVLIAFVIAIAMAIVMDCAGLGGGCCAGPLAAGAAVKVGQNFFLQYGGGAFHSTSRHALKEEFDRRGLPRYPKRC